MSFLPSILTPRRILPVAKIDKITASACAGYFSAVAPHTACGPLKTDSIIQKTDLGGEGDFCSPTVFRKLGFVEINVRRR